MNLNKAKKVLKENGYICEVTTIDGKDTRQRIMSLPNKRDVYANNSIDALENISKVLSAQVSKIKHISKLVKDEFGDKIKDMHIELIADKIYSHHLTAVLQLETVYYTIEIEADIEGGQGGAHYSAPTGKLPTYTGLWKDDADLLRILHREIFY